MQIRSLKFWQSQQESDTTDKKLVSTNTVNDQTVVKLPLESPLDSPTGLSGVVPASDTMYVSLRTRSIPTGLMSAEAMTAFFGQNFVTQGRYAGATQRTNDALELGINSVTSQFQNVVSLLISEKRAKLDNLLNVAAQSGSVSEIVSNQLDLARQKLERDISMLREQVELSEKRRGWILSSLNEYRIGFDRGLREAIDAELLGL